MRARKSARAMLLNERDEMLWLHVQDDIGRGGKTRLWCTPGGGLRPDETFEAALHREIYEEVGLVLDKGQTYEHVATFQRSVVIGGRPFNEHSRFYLICVENPALRFENPDLAELETFLGHGWWSYRDIQASDELFLPKEIVEVFGEIVQGRWNGEVRLIG